MQSRHAGWFFGLNYNFATDSVFAAQSVENISTFPVIPENFKLLDGTNFLLLDGTNFLLL